MHGQLVSQWAGGVWVPDVAVDGPRVHRRLQRHANQRSLEPPAAIAGCVNQRAALQATEAGRALRL